MPGALLFPMTYRRRSSGFSVGRARRLEAHCLVRRRICRARSCKLLLDSLQEAQYLKDVGTHDSPKRGVVESEVSMRQDVP